MTARSIAGRGAMALVWMLCVCVARAAYDPRAGVATVETLDLQWHDARRDRDVPARIYYPRDARGRLPLIIFSHGLGGSRHGYAYLGRAWAGAGCICVHLQHLGSDESVWRAAGLDVMGAMRSAVANPANALNRVEDVKFAIDQMLRLDAQRVSGGFDPFLGRIDADEIGMAGHSFGAWTTLAAVGQKLAVNRSLADPRIKAAIAMSAPVPAAGVREAFATISVPVFHMTGTRDNSPLGETKAADRRIPYDQSTAPGSCLLILNGGDHMTFSGHLIGAFGREDSRFQRLIADGSTAFWEATLKGDKAASGWLYGGGFKASLDAAGTFETRQP